MANNFNGVRSKMEERGIDRKNVRDWLEKEYAPVSDGLKLAMLTPTMCDNLIKDIENGKLEG